MKAPTLQIPTDAEVPALTDRLADIKAEIVKLKAEEKTLEARLELYALNQKGEHLGDEKREGRKVLWIRVPPPGTNSLSMIPPS